MSFGCKDLNRNIWVIEAWGGMWVDLGYESEPMIMCMHLHMYRGMLLFDEVHQPVKEASDNLLLYHFLERLPFFSGLLQ